MSEILAGGGAPSCVFAVSDVMTIGAMAALRESGMEPGTGVAVACFNDIPLAADVTPTAGLGRAAPRPPGRACLEAALTNGPPDGAEPVAARVQVLASTPRRR